MGEMLDTTDKKVCKTCHYVKRLQPEFIVCDYFLMTGKRRGCPIGLCDKYKPRTKRRNPFN